MKPYILTITLNPAVDKTTFVSNFKIGKDFREEALSVSAGGKGINVSRALSYLGIPTVASGLLSGPNGEYVKQQLNKEKIAHRFYTCNGNTRVSLTIIDPLHNTITRVLERGPTVTSKELRAFKGLYNSLLRHCHFVVLSGRNAWDAPESFYAELIRLAHRKNKPAVFDTSGKALILGIKKKPFMIKPNLGELEVALKKPIHSLNDMKKAIGVLQARGIAIVALTLGSRGALVSDGKQLVLATPPRIKRRNPVGCGDAFIAGFIASYSRKKTLQECAQMGVACGTANALSINPGFIKPGSVNTIKKNVVIKQLRT